MNNTGKNDWEQLRNKSIKDMTSIWLNSLKNKNTRTGYQQTVNKLFKLRILLPSWTVDTFTTANLNDIVDRIKNLRVAAEPTRQRHAAGFISFTKWLSRLTDGRTKTAVPEKFGAHKTFYAVRDKIKTPAMTEQQYQQFIDALADINYLHWIIARVAYWGAKRINEVLTARIPDIDFQNRRISFQQSKTRGTDRHTVITYSTEVMNLVADLIGERTKGRIFLEKRRKVTYQQISRSFSQAGHKARIPFRVTPHVLRATRVTILKTKKHSAEDISKLTGTTPASVMKYDKSDLADNISQLECI